MNLVILGSGNIAFHFAKALKNANFKIIQLYGRNKTTVSELAADINSIFTTDINDITEEADAYLFALSDNALKTVLLHRDWKNKTLIHTSGSTSMNVFYGFSNNYGVLYPLQSFSRDLNLNISEVPFFIEGNNYESLELIKEIAYSLSNNIIIADSETRFKVHLAAVFANNFVNHMITIGQQILINNNIPPEYISPLIKETFRKIELIGADKAQTGPAIRNDEEIIERHTKYLQDTPEWQKIYTFVTNSIKKYYNK